jgi:hypothetical protein
MFGTAAIRVLAFAGHRRGERTLQDVARPVQIAEANKEADVRPKRSARNMPWHSYEWWEDHHYERR